MVLNAVPSVFMCLPLGVRRVTWSSVLYFSNNV